MAIIKVATRWTGFAGAPGYTNFFFGSDGESADQVSAAVTAVSTFWNAIKTNIPNTVQLTVSPEVEALDERTGALGTVLTAQVPPAPIAGGATGTYTAAQGLVIHWFTGGVRRGRRVRGRTFVVPLSTNALSSGGIINSAYQTTVQNAAQAMVDNALANLVVWARPTRGANDGEKHEVTSARVPSLQAVLRTRRD
ncbi:hypothetical protein [Corynebacterium sp.]|uniref:hypothetical protein n=1 Tax=Corynebacterium sp. TaxID=1720 RepID=UPI002F409E23